MAKKKKREIGKRRSKAREKLKKKRALRLAKTSSKPEPQITYRPGLPHMGAPEGFRSISMSQAMLEYAKPLMKFLEDSEEGYNEVMQLSMLLWNYSISVERSNEDNRSKKAILQALEMTLGLDKNGAQALFTKMIERRAYLFPPDIQPEAATPFMFIRKEVRHIIRPFDYDKLEISNEIIPPNQDEQDLIDRIKRLDNYIYEEAEYETYENLLFSLQDECPGLFEKWLIAKGLGDDAQMFSFCLGTYFDFIYGYMHDDTVVLKSIPGIYFVEFFEDYLLRKMMVEPNEYVYWPPALKLFYQFLHEKGYLDNYEEIIKKIDKVEPYFIEVLRKQFS